MNELEEAEVGDTMVQRRDIQLTKYIPGARAPGEKTPPPRPIPWPTTVILAFGRKRQRVVDSLGVQVGVQHREHDAPTTFITINPSISQPNIPTEGLGNLLPTIKTKGASSSPLPHPSYQHSFMLGREALLATTFLRTYRKGDGGRVAGSLGKALMLPKDIHFWEDVTDEDLVLNLKWHSIDVSIFPRPFFNDNVDIAFCFLY